MPTATLRSPAKQPSGNVALTETTKTITHNNGRLYHESGRTYEYIGNDGNGDRIYRDTPKR